MSELCKRSREQGGKGQGGKGGNYYQNSQIGKGRLRVIRGVAIAKKSRDSWPMLSCSESSVTFFEVYVASTGYVSLHLNVFEAENLRQLQSPFLPSISKYSTPR